MIVLTNAKGQRCIGSEQPDGSYTYRLAPLLSDVDRETLICPYCNGAIASNKYALMCKTTTFHINTGLTEVSYFVEWRCDCGQPSWLPVERFELNGNEYFVEVW